MANIDLHTHTIHSDGGLTPNELVRKAKEVGLAAIAVSDHESVSGIEEALKTGKEVGIEVIPAIEVSAYPSPENEYHILGYFIDWQSSWLQEVLEHSRADREERAKKVVEKLKALGYQVSFEEVKAQAQGTIVQPHLAAAVINNSANKDKLIRDYGARPTTGEFIGDHLIPGKDAYVARKALTPKEALDLIHKVGGLAVLAHPCWNLTKKDPSAAGLVFDDQAIEELVKLGLEGIEVFAHRDNEEDTKLCIEHYSKLAEKLSLVVSGGSDFHGFGSAGKKLGFEDFYLKVPEEVLAQLKTRVKIK